LWLYSLLPLLIDPNEGYPMFMQSDAWLDKQLLTALGSWAELRHDTILYTKQSSVTATSTHTSTPEPEYHGFVEPVPRVYSRLNSLCQTMYYGLSSRFNIAFDNKLLALSNILEVLETISIKELSNVALSSSERSFIENYGDSLEGLLTFYSSPLWLQETDDRIAVVADIHTTTGVINEVLEVAVGNPMNIYVVVKVGNTLVMTRGASFSYYEFRQPINERLTDETWQYMIDHGLAPPLPSWTSSFIQQSALLLSAANVLSPSDMKMENYRENAVLIVFTGFHSEYLCKRNGGISRN